MRAWTPKPARVLPHVPDLYPRAHRRARREGLEHEAGDSALTSEIEVALLSKVPTSEQARARALASNSPATCPPSRAPSFVCDGQIRRSPSPSRPPSSRSASTSTRIIGGMTRRSATSLAASSRPAVAIVVTDRERSLTQNSAFFIRPGPPSPLSQGSAGARAGSEVACNAEVVIDGAVDGHDADDREQAQGWTPPENLAKTPDDPDNATAHPHHDRSDAGTSVVLRLGHDLTLAGLNGPPWCDP